MHSMLQGKGNSKDNSGNKEIHAQAEAAPTSDAGPVFPALPTRVANQCQQPKLFQAHMSAMQIGSKIILPPVLRAPKSTQAKAQVMKFTDVLERLDYKWLKFTAAMRERFRPRTDRTDHCPAICAARRDGGSRQENLDQIPK